jgi:hypothetical protein|tara:strand:+ start:1223 stop:1876 length:654 start_codon:yes stop_codon:yes gene_type:complete
MADYGRLKTRQRNERDKYSESFGLRVHRALSWLNRAEQCSDEDGRFIFLWISFNSAYSQQFDDEEHTPEQKAFAQFLEKIVRLDREKILAQLIWEEYSGSIRLLLDNRFVFKAYWDYQNGAIDKVAWEDKFKAAKTRANLALKKQDTVGVISIVLARMYTLRNQLVHGGATWNSNVNRDQLKDATLFLGKLVPFIIELMLDNPHAIWGDVVYPPIRD